MIESKFPVKKLKPRERNAAYGSCDRGGGRIGAATAGRLSLGDWNSLGVGSFFCDMFERVARNTHAKL